MIKYTVVFIIALTLYSCSSSQKDKSNSYTQEIKNYQKKQDLGIDFFALGNNPYWSLDMDTEDSTRIILNIRNTNSTLLVFKSPYPIIDTTNKTIVYKFTDNAVLKIKGETCLNSTSQEINGFSAILTINEINYSGCGKYIIASKNPFLSQETLRLNDIWALKSINGKEINRSDFKSGIPMVELHLNDGRFYGKIDCNEIFGHINVGDSYINFTNISLTKISCEGDFEDVYVNTLKNVDSWKLEKMNLILKSRGKDVLKYIKID